MKSKPITRLLIAALLGLLFAGSALAGTGGTEFAGVYALIKGWSQGTLGQIIAVGFALTGLMAGWARGSLFAAVSGLGAGLILYYLPTVVESIVTGIV